MEEKKYSVLLADGTLLSDLTLNGNNYISKAKIDPSIFTDNCSPVVISDGETEEEHENMALVQVMRFGDEYHFILRDLTEAELKEIQLRSDVEYIAMMTGIEL